MTAKETRDDEASAASANQSVTMSARILGELAASAQPLGVSELARRLGESKARIFRHLATMRQVGFVSQEAAGGDYRLGWNIYRLGVAAAEQFGLLRIAQRHMTRLRDLTQETTALAIPANGDAMVVGSVQSERQVAVSIKHGVVIPANSSALGRVALAFSSEDVQRRVLQGELRSFSKLSIVDPAELKARLDFVVQNYYEVAINENGYGIATLAAPVFDQDERIVAAVAVVGSSMGITRPPDEALLTAVQGCAAEISSELDSGAWDVWRAATASATKQA